MVVGIYKISKRKCNQRQLEFIKTRYYKAVTCLVVYALLVVYLAAVTVFVAQIDSEDPFVHQLVLKLDIILLQPMALYIIVYVKLFYLVLEIFARKDIWISNLEQNTVQCACEPPTVQCECRAFKDLLFTSSQENGFLSVWYRYGTGVAVTFEIVYNIGYVMVMFVGIYKVSKKKSNKKQLEYINAKCKSAFIYLLVYVVGVLYFGWVASYISGIDNDNHQSHLYILKLDVILFQPMAIHALVFLKLYYILLEMFAKKDVLRCTQSKDAKKRNVQDDTQLLKGSKRPSDEHRMVPDHAGTTN
ncbi:hypothetical protein HK103_001510 [Boothiomyces macroporosus]|uniref:Uncharacterized protein n=1 Tax=Boothiomyces macroporosus TaxID=261099 RepID=A0AAD5UJX6_9FUNG|nr:hypothetical protein HK103_001510 [Boothiomyces macroporosus]